MSFCQPDNSNFSCGACCGFLNLKLSKKEIIGLLAQRTIEFQGSVHFQENHTIAAYRQSREKIEKDIPKFDETTYNCPFLGNISAGKVGCMIHPEATQNPKSQNFSFYGASICQGYDCKNKERQTAEHWERFLANLDIDSFSYSLIAGDHVSLSKIENFFFALGIEGDEFFQTLENILIVLIEKILYMRGLKDSMGFITSFETDYSTPDEDTLYALCERLGIQPDTKFFEKMKNIAKEVLT